MLRHRLACVLLSITVTAPAWGQVDLAGAPAVVTVGELMARVRERCEVGRAALGPFQMKVEIERPAADVAPTTAVLLVMDDKVMAILSAGPQGGLLKILDDGTSLFCNPAGAMGVAEMRGTLDTLLLGFDCDRLADAMGLSPETPVAVEASEGAQYYRLDPPVNALRWIDAEDLTLAEEWAGDGETSVRDVYNNWVPMGAGAWYPELMEQVTDDVVTLRLKVEYLSPAPDMLPGVFSLENFYSTWTLDDMVGDDMFGEEEEYEEAFAEDEG